MATSADIIARAKSQVGYTESPPGSNLTKYGKWYGMDGEPWCAMFVSWVFYFSGVPLDISTSKGYAYCPAGVDWFKARNLWRSSYASKTGDVVFFNFVGGSEAEHTGIVYKNNPALSYIWTIEGNTSGNSNANGGQVEIRQRPRSFVLGTGNVQRMLKHNKPVPAPSWTKDGYAHPQLKKGSRGRSVVHMQTKLLKHGQNLVIDGDFGDQTLKCLKSYQSSHSLNVDGVCGYHAWEHLHH